MSELVVDKKDLEIKKSEALVKGRYKLSKLALKLITFLISSVQKNDKHDKIYSLSVNDFKKISGIKNKDIYNELRLACLEIMEKPIEIGNKKNKDFLILNWASSCEYRNGIIEFQISPKILPFLINLKERFLRYNIANILALRSSYSIRFYELLKDIYNKNSRYNQEAEVILEIDYLINILKIPQSYNFQSIKTRILEKAKKDLEINTDIKFFWEVAKKRNKKITHIKITVFLNEKNADINDIKPSYLNGYMPFVNYLKAKYKGNGKMFFIAKFILDDVKDVYFFGINNKNLVYAISKDGGDSILLSKKQAEVILNASYLCATKGFYYRTFLEEDEDFLYLKNENRELFNAIKKEIVDVLIKNNAKILPTI